MKTYKKFKDNNKLYLSLLICLSLSIFNSHSQVTTTNNLGGLVEVEQIQEAFGDNANYFVKCLSLRLFLINLDLINIVYGDKYKRNTTKILQSAEMLEFIGEIKVG